ncbi:MAG: hypothetical protein ABSC42_00850 [Tepidisphaeraceae bacterium]|jgi:hypothetical protein
MRRPCIKSTHISIEPFHTAAYLDAEAFRFNNREVQEGDRFKMAMQRVTGKRLTYKGLIGAPTDGRSENDKSEANNEKLN